MSFYISTGYSLIFNIFFFFAVSLAVKTIKLCSHKPLLIAAMHILQKNFNYIIDFYYEIKKIYKLVNKSKQNDHKDINGHSHGHGYDQRRTAKVNVTISTSLRLHFRLGVHV